MKKQPANIELVLLLLLSSLLSGCVDRTSTPDPGTSSWWPVFYVSSDGNNGNDCLSPETACQTTFRIMEMAGAYDWLDIHYGEGTFFFPEEVDHSGFLDRNIGLFGAGADATLLYSWSGAAVQIAAGRHVGLGDLTTSVDVFIDGGATLAIVNARVRDSDRFGVSNVGGELLVDNSEITHNGFGGIYTGGGAYTRVRNSKISDNNRTGILVLDSGSLEVAETSIYDNHNTESGDNHIMGAGIDNSGNATIDGSTINNNTGAFAIRNVGTLTMVNSTVSSNQVEPEGGALWSNGHLELTYTTIANNLGLGVGASNLGNVNFTNSLMVGNDGGDCDLRLAAHVAFAGRNFDSDGSCLAFFSGTETMSIITDVRLGPLADNGGPTLTHALLEGSSAIDTALGNCPETDQRGNARHIGGGCDVGAYEYYYAATAAATGTPATNPAMQSPAVSRDTLCWEGPGDPYNVVSSIPAGTPVQLLGAGAQKGWYVVDNPRYHVPCWLPQQNLNMPPDVTNLQVYPVPQLPVVVIPTETSAPPPQPPPQSPPQSPPNAPYKLYVQNHVCAGSTYTVTLAWNDASDNETGFRVYRDGALIITLGANVTSYTDSPPTGGPYYYLVEAFNAAGAAQGNSARDDGCIF